MIDKSDTWIEIWSDDETHIIDAFHWPFCVVEGCGNRIKRGVSDLYCHPHSGGKTADEFIKKLNEPVKEQENA